MFFKACEQETEILWVNHALSSKKACLAEYAYDSATALEAAVDFGRVYFEVFYNLLLMFRKHHGGFCRVVYHDVNFTHSTS